MKKFSDIAGSIAEDAVRYARQSGFLTVRRTV